MSDMLKPLFLTIESVDGLGKTTQIELLESHIRKQKIPLYRTKEPGDHRYGSVLGAGLRNILFSNHGTKILAPGVSDLLFLADHVQNSHDIKNELDKGNWVLSDRYADSQFAYVRSSSKRCPEWAYKYYKEQYGTKPDIIILLRAIIDSSVMTFEWALDRAQKRTGEEVGKQEGKAWNNYQEQLKIQSQYMTNLSDKENCLVIDVFKEDNPITVHHNILSRLYSYFEADANYGAIFKK